MTTHARILFDFPDAMVGLVFIACGAYIYVANHGRFDLNSRGRNRLGLTVMIIGVALALAGLWVDVKFPAN